MIRMGGQREIDSNIVLLKNYYNNTTAKAKGTLSFVDSSDGLGVPLGGFLKDQ